MRALLLLLLVASGPAAARPVQIPTPDGALPAEVSGQGSRGVVLVHDDAGAASDWDELRARLAARGFQVVAVGLRGAPGRDAGGWVQAARDVTAASAWLRTQGVTEVSLVGAGLGGNAALHAAGVDTAVRGVALIGPRLSAPGLSITQDLAGLDERPLLLVASSGDPTAVRAAQALAGKAARPQVEVVDAPTTGARLLLDVPRLEGDLVGWLSAPPADSGVVRPKSALAEGRVGELETTGTKYGR